MGSNTCVFKSLISGATIVSLQKSLTYFKQIITAKTSNEEYLADPSIVFNLNLAHLLTSFSTIELTARWTAFGVLIPATKPLILVAGNKGYTIQSFDTFQKRMKTSKGINISPITKNVDQILVVDDKDTLRFARIDEPVKLHCRATAFAHVFANIVSEIVEKESNILEQVYELSSLKDSSRTSQNVRKKRNVLDFFLGRSTGDKYIHLSPPLIVKQLHTPG